MPGGRAPNSRNLPRCGGTGPGVAKTASQWVGSLLRGDWRDGDDKLLHAELCFYITSSPDEAARCLAPYAFTEQRCMQVELGRTRPYIESVADQL